MGSVCLFLCGWVEGCHVKIITLEWGVANVTL
jgi:hypothetical protein